MKKVIFSILLFFCIVSVSAQNITIQEPEFVEDTYLLTSDSTFVELPREKPATTTSGFMSANIRIILNGETSPITIPTGDIRLIIRSVSNDYEAETIARVFPFEIKKGQRRLLLAHANIFKAEANTSAYLPFQAKKYGNNSYLITLKDLKPGEYGIILHMPNVKRLKLMSFTVK